MHKRGIQVIQISILEFVHGNNGNLYYLKGNVYCTRLYEKALSSVEVEFNVETTQLYRQTLQ